MACVVQINGAARVKLTRQGCSILMMRVSDCTVFDNAKQETEMFIRGVGHGTSWLTVIAAAARQTASGRTSERTARRVATLALHAVQADSLLFLWFCVLRSVPACHTRQCKKR